MSAQGFGYQDKVNRGGDTMTGTLTLAGTPALTFANGAADGYVLETDANGNVTPVPGSFKVFNLLTYGAVADGVTDNHPAYVSAIAAIDAAGGGVLYIPAGTYYSSLPLNPHSATVVQGDGIDVTILLPSTTNTGGNGDGIRTVTNALPYYSNITIRDLTVDCSATYPTLANYGSLPSPFSNGVTMQGVHDLLIERVKIVKPCGFGADVGSSGGNAPYVERTRVRDLYVLGERGGYDSLGGGGILHGSVDGLYVFPAADGTATYGTANDWTDMRSTTIRKVRAWAPFTYGMYTTTTPAVPPGATRLVNPYAFPVTVTFTSNTADLTNVTINEVSQTVGSPWTYTLPAFGTISISYTVTPTWTWTVPAAPSVPATGTPVTNPFSYPVPVDITGGTVSAVIVGGVTQGTTSGWFVVPAGATIQLTYSAAPTWTWNTTNSSGAIVTDFGCVDVLYEDIVVNGFHDGVIISKPLNKPFPSNITIRDSKFINIGFHGVDTNVATGYGIAGFKVIDCYFDTYAMLGAGACIQFFGTKDFEIRGCMFGAYGTTSNGIDLNTDGTNACDYGLVVNNDVRLLGSFTIGTHSGAGATSNVKFVNNIGYNPAGPLTAPSIPTSATAYTNAFNVDCTVFVTGGTVSAIAIGGTATGFTSGTFRVPSGQTITLTYSVAPSWTWFGD